LNFAARSQEDSQRTENAVLRASSGPYRRDCSTTERRLRARLLETSVSCAQWPPESRSVGRAVYLCNAATCGERPDLPRLGVDASRRGPDEDSRRGRDQAKNAVAATSRDRNPASGALVQDQIAITDAGRGDMRPGPRHMKTGDLAPGALAFCRSS